MATNSEVVLTSGSTVSNNETNNTIATYNGYPTLAEALADENFNGTISLALSEEDTVSFAYANSNQDSVYVDGVAVATGTNVIITSGSTISNSQTNNTIATYNGFSTLAEALADESFNGTISLTVTSNSTTYKLTRVGAGELEYGVNYMFFNTAQGSGPRYGIIYYDGSVKMNNGAVPESFTTNDANYIFQLTDANTLYSVGMRTNVGTNFTFTPWEEATNKSSNCSSRNDDGTYTANANIGASNKVWTIHNGSESRGYWNANEWGGNWTPEGGNSFSTWYDGHPFAIYKVEEVSFVYANSNQDSVYVNGIAVATGTEVFIFSDPIVSNSAYGNGNGIISYNGYSTLAEALADENFNGTVTLALSEERSDITIYLMRGGTAIKTVTLNDIPSGTGFSIGDVVGTPAFVTGFNPATITGTAEDQTIYATYTSTLPMNLAADPTSSNASSYVMTLHSKYAHGNDATSSNVSTVNLSDNTYLWSFGGNEWDGITVYNKGNGYLNVGYRTDNSVATFSETPTTFAISPNNNATNGFELKIPNKFAYVSERSGKVSTLLNASASGNSGNTLVVYSKEDVLDAQIDALRDNYLGGSDVVGTLPSEDIATYTSEINILANNPSVEGYQELKTRLDAALIPLESGKYYIIRNAYPYFYSIQIENKVWYYNGSTVRWESEGTDPAYEVFQVVEKSNGDQVFYNPMGGVYLRSVYGAVTTDISAANAVSLSALGDGQQNIFIGGASSPIHTNDYDYGNGVEGSLTGWAGTANSPSAWYIVPQNIEEITLIAPEGVADGEDVMQGFANETDAQLPLNIIVYTISDETGVGAHIETVEGSQIAAGEGYIISGVKGATVPLLPVAKAVDVPAGNLLKAGTGATVNSGYILAYKKGDTEAKFWAIGGSGLTIPANRSYLPAGTPTRGLEFLLGNGYIDDVTGINCVNDGATTSDAIYDLQGRRVNNAAKGVYIINGKKVIKK